MGEIIAESLLKKKKKVSEHSLTFQKIGMLIFFGLSENLS